MMIKGLSVLTVFLFVGSFASAKIAFLKQNGNDRMVVVADDSGASQKIISKRGTDTYHPEISPSGGSVAYSRGLIRAGSEVKVELVIKNLVDESVEIWTPKGDQYIHAEFSGNGRYLVFSGPHTNGKQNIMFIDLAKERQKEPIKVEIVDGVLEKTYSPDFEVIESDFDCFAPAVSSDGELIVYHRTKDKSNKESSKQIVMYSRGNKEKIELTNRSGHAMFPTLSADERYMSFVSKDHGQWDVFLKDLWTGEVRQITKDPNIEYTPVFSTVGDLYYTRFENKDDEFEIDIYKINKSEVFDSNEEARATPFLNQKGSFEYVVSFSKSIEVHSEPLEDFLEPARSSFGTVFHQGKVYMAGGHQGPEHTYPKESFLRNLEVYDLETKTWMSLPSMNIPKHGFQMAAYGNYLYVFGGFTFSEAHVPQWKSLDSIERYDIKNGKWEVLSVKLQSPRSSNALAVVNDQVYLIGGWNSTPKFEGDKNGRFLNMIEIFDLKTETLFISDTKLPQPLRRAFTAVAVDEEIYLLGGIGEGVSHFDWIDNVTVLNTNNMKFSEKAPLPFATFAPGAGVLNGDIFLIGGMVLQNKETYALNYVDDIYRYSQLDQEWSHTGLYLDQNKGFPQVVPLPGQALGILGGHTYQLTQDGWIDHPVKTFEVLRVDQ